MTAMAGTLLGALPSFTGVTLQKRNSSSSSPGTASCLKSNFWGENFLRSDSNSRKHYLKNEKKIPGLGLPIAKIKRRKDPQLDTVVERDKKVRIVTKIKELLCKQERRIMTLKQLGLHRRMLGLKGKRRCIVLLRRFPAVFEVHDEGAGQIWFRFTRAADEQLLKELYLKERMEGILVDKIRKLLMMSTEKRLVVQKLTHLRRDLGLPLDFTTSILPKYPQYFRLKDSLEGPVLELTSWDPCLAVSALEHRAAKDAAKLRPKEDLNESQKRPVKSNKTSLVDEVDETSLPVDDEGHVDDAKGSNPLLTQGQVQESEELLFGEEAAMAAIARGKAAVGAGTYGSSTDPTRHSRVKRVNLNFPAGYTVSRKDLQRLQSFLDLPFVSPYSNSTRINPATPEAEKRSVAVIHEMLSLTIEKRLLCDHFTHFRKDYRMSQRLRGMIIRHPELFYVSEKGHRDSVFLREAYNGPHLINKDPLVEVGDSLRELVLLGKKVQKLESDDEEEWDDEFGDDDDEDEDEDGDDEDDDDWSDDDDDVDSDDGDTTVRKKYVSTSGYVRGTQNSQSSPPVLGRVKKSAAFAPWRRQQPEKQEVSNAPPKDIW